MSNDITIKKIEAATAIVVAVMPTYTVSGLDTHAEKNIAKVFKATYEAIDEAASEHTFTEGLQQYKSRS